MSIERNSHQLWWLQSSKTGNIKLTVMTSLYTFLPKLRKLNVNSILCRVLVLLLSQSLKHFVLKSWYQNFVISVISVILTVNYATDDLIMAIFVINGSKSTLTNVLFFYFCKFCFYRFSDFFTAIIG